MTILVHALFPNCHLVNSREAVLPKFRIQQWMHSLLDFRSLKLCPLFHSTASIASQHRLRPERCILLRGASTSSEQYLMLVCTPCFKDYCHLLCQIEHWEILVKLRHCLFQDLVWTQYLDCTKGSTLSWLATQLIAIYTQHLCGEANEECQLIFKPISQLSST